MYKTINFYDKAIDIFYIEAGNSLKEALGKEFKKFETKFLEGVDKAFFELPVEKEYKNLFNYYRGFDDIKLEDLIDEFSLSKNDPFVKEYEKEYFNIRALTIWEEELKFGCLVLDPERTVFEGVKKIIEVGKDSFMYGFSFNGEFRVIVLIKL